MPGALLWGYDATNKKWIPLQVDANGYVKVDLSNVNLNDLADVNAPTPSDGQALVWDNATSKWIPAAGAAAAWADITGKPTAPSLEELATEHDADGLHAGAIVLGDADIPATIARDAEVATAISDHEGDASAHHTKYTNAEAKAAAVLAGAITDAETKAPTHDAVFDVKATADGAIAKSLLTERGSVIFRNATVPAELLHGTAGQVLQSGGHGADPSWVAAPGGTKIQDADGDTSWDTEESADEDKIHGKVAGVEAFLLHDDGILTLPKQSACKAYLATPSQVIPNTTYTKVTLNTESFDIQGEFDSTTNYRFTAKKAGIYICSLLTVFGNPAAGVGLWAAFYLNGTSAGGYQFYCGAQGYQGPGFTITLQLAVDDYIEMYVWQNSGGDLDLVYGEKNTWMSISKVA